MLADLFARESSVNLVRCFAVVYCGAVALRVLLSFSGMLRYFRSRPPDLPRGRILGWLQVPSLDTRLLVVVGAVFVAALVLICAGVVPRYATGVALIAYFLFFGQLIDLSYVGRKTNMIPTTLLVLLLSPGVGAPLDAPALVWPLELLRVLFATAILAAGVSKLRGSGLRWANGRPLQAYLMHNYLWTDSRAGLLLARMPRMCTMFSAVTLTWELTFPLVVFFPVLVVIYIPIAIGFHLSTDITMRIDYFRFWGISYLLFVPDSVATSIVAWWHSL